MSSADLCSRLFGGLILGWCWCIVVRGQQGPSEHQVDCFRVAAAIVLNQ